MRISPQESECKYALPHSPGFLVGHEHAGEEGIEHEGIIDAVNKAEDFRLRNLAGSMPIEERQDRLVVELFPLNKTYGCSL